MKRKEKKTQEYSYNPLLLYFIVVLKNDNASLSLPYLHVHLFSKHFSWKLWPSGFVLWGFCILIAQYIKNKIKKKIQKHCAAKERSPPKKKLLLVIWDIWVSTDKWWLTQNPVKVKKCIQQSSEPKTKPSKYQEAAFKPRILYLSVLFSFVFQYSENPWKRLSEHVFM